MATFRVILTKRGTWRGNNEDWSNGYYLNGTAPTDRASWEALFKALWLQEEPFHRGQRLVKAYGYADPNGNVTIGRDYIAVPDGTIAVSTGSALTTGGTVLSLEQASLMKARCGYTSKGKPRYVMKFFHGTKVSDADTVAWVAPGAGLTALLAGWTNGSLPGSAKLCRPDGQVCETPTVSNFVTTRTLKRRGKRPSS